MNRTKPNHDARYPYGDSSYDNQAGYTANAHNSRARRCTQHSHILQYGIHEPLALHEGAFHVVVMYHMASYVTSPPLI